MKTKSEIAAEEYATNHNTGPTDRIRRCSAFLAGVEWRDKDLLESAEGFDEKAVIAQSLKDQWALECPDCSSLIPDTKSLVRGARWQHTQDQLKIQALKEEVETLEYNGLHTCHANCKRLPCVQRRKIDELEAEIAKLKGGV